VEAPFGVGAGLALAVPRSIIRIPQKCQYQQGFTPLTVHFYQFILVSSQKQVDLGIND
jgi:hypothetical protein